MRLPQYHYWIRGRSWGCRDDDEIDEYEAWRRATVEVEAWKGWRVRLDVY